MMRFRLSFMLGVGFIIAGCGGPHSAFYNSKRFSEDPLGDVVQFLDENSENKDFAFLPPHDSFKHAHAFHRV